MLYIHRGRTESRTRTHTSSRSCQCSVRSLSSGSPRSVQDNTSQTCTRGSTATLLTHHNRATSLNTCIVIALATSKISESCITHKEEQTVFGPLHWGAGGLRRRLSTESDIITISEWEMIYCILLTAWVHSNSEQKSSQLYFYSTI